MLKVQKLKRVVESTSNDGTQISRLPNNQEMIDKIKEIIDFVNKNVDMKNPFLSKK